MDPRVCYVFIPRDRRTVHGVQSGNPDLFNTHFHQAVKGDWVMVMLVYKMLETAAEGIPGYGRNGLRRQIFEEFEVDPGSTEGNMEIVQTSLEQMQTQHPDMWQSLMDAAVHETEHLNKYDMERVPRWRKPKPGHSRSPALLHQLRMLDKEETKDYFFIFPRPDSDVAIRLPDRSAFWPVFLRVICDFDPMGVLVLHKMLKSTASSIPGYGEDGLKKQLFKEFGVDIDEQTRVYLALKRT